MKRIISIILAIVICVAGCFMLTACSAKLVGTAVNAYNEYNKEAEIEIAKSSFSAVMENVNGFITIKGEFPLEITSNTTIQQVVDAIENEGMNVLTENIDTEARFLAYCEMYNGYYVIRFSLADDYWLELYED